MAKTKEDKKSEKAAASSNGEGRVRHWLDNKFIKDVKERKDKGDSVAEIAKALDVAKGQVALALLRAEVPVKDRLTLEDEPAELQKQVVRLRNDESLSWGIISARLGVPESLVRSTYKEATGTDHKGNRIGKGGRHPGDGSGESKPKAGKEKADKSVTKGKTNTAKVVPLVDMNKAELTERLRGNTLTIGRGGKTEKIKVREVTGLKKGEVTFTDDPKGAVHTVKVSDISRAR